MDQLAYVLWWPNISYYQFYLPQTWIMLLTGLIGFRCSWSFKLNGRGLLGEDHVLLLVQTLLNLDGWWCTIHVVIMDLTSLDTDSEPYVSDARKILKYFEQVNFLGGAGALWWSYLYKIYIKTGLNFTKSGWMMHLHKKRTWQTFMLILIFGFKMHKFFELVKVSKAGHISVHIFIISTYDSSCSDMHCWSKYALHVYEEQYWASSRLVLVLIRMLGQVKVFGVIHSLVAFIDMNSKTDPNSFSLIMYITMDLTSRKRGCTWSFKLRVKRILKSS